MRFLVAVNGFFFFLLINFSVLVNAVFNQLKLYVLFFILFFLLSLFFGNIKFVVKILKSVVFRIFFVLLFWLLLSVFYSDWNDASFGDFSKIIFFTIASFLIFLFLFCVKIDFLFYVFSFTAFFQLAVFMSALLNYGIDNLIILFATGQAFSGSPIFSDYIQQVFESSIIGNSQNVYSALLASFFFLFLVFRALSKTTFISTFVFYCSFIAYAFIFILSLSKTSLIIFFGLSFFYILYFSPVKGSISIAFLAFLSVLSGVANLIYNRFAAMFDGYSGDVTMSSRDELWQIAFKIIEDHPWIGMGFRVSNDLFIRGSDDGVNNPHNIILRHWVDGGVIAVVLYLLMIGYIFYQLVNVKVNNSSSLLFVKMFSAFYFVLFFLRNMFAFQMTEFDFFLVVPLIYFIFYRYANSCSGLEQVNNKLN